MTSKELSKLHEDALHYCLQRLQHTKIRKRVWLRAVSIEKYPSVLLERVNIPGVGESICEYHLFTKPKIGSPFTINASFYREDALYIVTDKCYSGQTDGSVVRKSGKFFLALHSHAVERYIERHHFGGSYRDAEEYILLNYRQVAYKMDMTTNEIICPFDSGVFLGYEDEEGVVHLKTFVMNRQLFLNQRLDEVKAKKFGEEVLGKEVSK